MRALTVPELLNVWEQGLDRSPVERALTVLAAACPDIPWDDLARLSIGQRDTRLLLLREWTFGPRMVSLVTCPECGERLELAFKTDDLRVAAEAEAAETFMLNVDGHELRFRLPNSLDLAVLENHEDVDLTRQKLLECCLLGVQPRGKRGAVEELSAEAVDSIAERMAEADPQADVKLAISCSRCSHEWRSTFDIVSFFWAEIDSWANRILDDVHLLASAYGWREEVILAMSPRRRRSYLDRIAG